MKYQDDYREFTTMTNETNRHQLTGTAFGAIDNEYVYLTKQIRIPRTNILTVRPTRNGNGAIVVTERGAMRVCEDYSALMYHLYDTNVPTGGEE